MSLDIDITDKRSEEIIQIMELYPKGHLEIKFERVFWVSVGSGPASRYNPSGAPPGSSSNRPIKQVNAGLQRMSDVLGSMMGPAPRG